MSISYSMTDTNAFEAKINGIKRRVDMIADVAANIVGAISDIDVKAELQSATQYKKVGGLHFAKVGGASMSWSFKRKAVAPVAAPVQQIEIAVIPELLASRINRFVK